MLNSDLGTAKDEIYNASSRIYVSCVGLIFNEINIATLCKGNLLDKIKAIL